VQQKLKILQIANRVPYPLNDGGNIATYHVTKYLHKFGHQVILASLNTKKHYQDPAVLQKIARVYTTKIDTSVTPWGLLQGLFQKMPYNIRRFISDDFSKQLIQILHEEQPDIIHIEGIYLAVYIDVLRRHSKAPILLRSHNIEYEIWQRTSANEKNPLKKWYLHILSKKIKRFEEKYLHLFDGIMAITERDADFYRQNNFKGTIRTVPAGADFETYQPAADTSDAPSICFLGSMEWMPNVQGIEWYLSHVWPTLHARHPSLTLHIAGKNMPEEMHQRSIDDVTFHGMVANAATFLNTHPIMIVPLLSGGGMRLKIVEAMALGRCIISTTIGAEGIEAQNRKELLLADTPEQFVAQTEWLLEDRQRAKALGQQAQKLAHARYSWEKLVREIEMFYLEQLEN
jgi:glycosyltransferase involved in cell wall biosynthesis